jgi:hypothetical protein
MNFSFRRVGYGVAFGIVGIVLYMLSHAAFAGKAELTWQVPLTYCDNSPMATPDSYTLTYGQKKETLLPGTTVSHTVTGLAPGFWWFSLAANVTNPTAVPPKVDQSQFATVEKEILPEDFRTVSTAVYTFIRAEGKVLVLPTLHTVPLGTVCDASQSVNGKFVLPRSAVSWSGSARLVAVLGDCG